MAKKENTTQAVTGNPAIDTALQSVSNAKGAVATLLGPTLNSTTRKRVPRVRRNGQQTVATWIGLAQLVPGLAPPDMDPAALVSQLQEYQQLVSLSNAVSGFALQLSDTLAERQGVLWTASLDLYGIAQHWKGSNAEVNQAVLQMKAALALGPKASQAKKPKKSKQTSTASPAPASGDESQSNGPATAGTSSGTTQQVPLYGPNGPEGSVPATNSAKS